MFSFSTPHDLVFEYVRYREIAASYFHAANEINNHVSTINKDQGTPIPRFLLISSHERLVNRSRGQTQFSLNTARSVTKCEVSGHHVQFTAPCLFLWVSITHCTIRTKH